MTCFGAFPYNVKLTNLVQAMFLLYLTLWLVITIVLPQTACSAQLSQLLIKNVLVYTHNSIYESTFAINCDSLVDKPQYKYSLEKFAMPASSLKNCLKKWEEVYEQKCGEAVEVKLIGVFPPIERMDNSLTKLEMC